MNVEQVQDKLPFFGLMLRSIAALAAMRLEAWAWVSAASSFETRATQGHPR
jgi:hypothetical protein